MAAGAEGAYPLYYPFHRDEGYPKHLGVDFRRMKPATLKKYARSYGIELRPDATPDEYAIAVARHFETRFDVDEDVALSRFMTSVRKQPPSVADADTMRRYRSDVAASHVVDPALMDVGSMPAQPYMMPGMVRRDIPEAAMAYDPRMMGAAMAPGMMYYQEHAMPMAHDPGAMVGGGEIEKEEYIACDHPECPTQWYKLVEVGLTADSIPEGKWYCPSCRENPYDHSIPARTPKIKGKKARSKTSKRKRR